MKPFKQIKLKNIIFRFFYKKDDINLYYKWHFDEHTRKVWFLPIGKWELQLNEQLPQKLSPFKYYTIPKQIYHRIIQKKGYLFCIIFE